MVEFLLGVSICFNIIFIISFIIIYHYSLKGIKKNIENYILNNFLDVYPKNTDWLGGLYDHK